MLRKVALTLLSCQGEKKKPVTLSGEVFWSGRNLKGLKNDLDHYVMKRVIPNRRNAAREESAVHLILAIISTKPPKSVIPTGAARLFLSRSLVRTRRAVEESLFD
jgi:hypothetical protein